jgi:signal transduction histidine kinase
VEPPPDVRTLTYRICQEAIANVRKHAAARLVEISLSLKGSGISVQIKDDGAGFDAVSADVPVPGHMGLIAMRERAEMSGGTFIVNSVAGQGTSVEFWLPIEAPAPPMTGLREN